MPNKEGTGGVPIHFGDIHAIDFWFHLNTATVLLRGCFILELDGLGVHDRRQAKDLRSETTRFFIICQLCTASIKHVLVGNSQE